VRTSPGRSQPYPGDRVAYPIDVYPGNSREWEAENRGLEASEEIHGLFGEGSQFHRSHGFFIDGVDEATAKLPPDWRKRAVTRRIEGAGGAVVTAIAPNPSEIVAAKLVRGLDKDLEFAARCIGAGLASNAAVKEALRKTVSGKQLDTCLKQVDRASRAKTDPLHLTEAAGRRTRKP
jgi:hypothetical protein